MYASVGRIRIDKYGRNEVRETRYYLVRNVDVFGNSIGITYVDEKDGLITVYDDIKTLKYVKIYDDLGQLVRGIK